MTDYAPLRTSINGKPAPWPEAVQAKWIAATKDWPVGDAVQVTDSNYFTPRPYVDEYNRGSRTEGFTYTIRRLPFSYCDGPQVCQMIIRRHNRIGGDE